MLATATPMALTGNMNPLVLPLSCVSDVGDCNDTSGFIFGWPELLLFLLVAAVVVGTLVLLVRSQRRR